MPISNKLLAKSSRKYTWVTKLIHRIMRIMRMEDVEKTTRQMMSSIPDTDKSVLYSPANIDIPVNSIRVGFRRGSDGVALDDILVNSDWKFELTDIKPQIDIWLGELDVNVPVHAGKCFNDMILSKRIFFLPGDGHFFLIGRRRDGPQHL